MDLTVMNLPYTGMETKEEEEEEEEEEDEEDVDDGMNEKWEIPTYTFLPSPFPSPSFPFPSLSLPFHYRGLSNEGEKEGSKNGI